MSNPLPDPGLDKHYTPAEVEARWLNLQEQAGLFSEPQGGEGERFTILMPPPNVTGALHVGHALTFTIQDVLIRWHRMQGKKVWWQPGLDHAGISTQMMVERQLWEEGQATRHTLGREAFLDKVWQWKEKSGGQILKQLRRLGASADWSRVMFTMDPPVQAAVRKAFVQLHQEGLIYRAHRLVNWDPKLQTALSDLEVVSKETRGTLYYIAFPVGEKGQQALVVATTRPETLFGDVAVAVHPDDERYRAFVGQEALIPLVGRRIPVIADAAVDMDQGSGVLKITPAHDFDDYQTGLRHGLPCVVMMDGQGCLAGEHVPEAFRGLDRFEARSRVIAALEAEGFLIRTEPVTHMVPHGDRSGVVLEPRLMEQWFLDAARLAGPALEAVRTGDTRFVPAQWQNLYEEWLSAIQPWCLSRQIWWGHRIPAWYGPDGQVFVAEDQAEAMAQAEKVYGGPVPLRQDEDVLDTWFSAGLWPFVTQGWPEQTAALQGRYPSDVLVTGFDIIFFWVARMMMLGLWFLKKPPFRIVAIHGLVRDAQGQKMSKTKGNVLDPLVLMDAYGADALRFALLWSLAPGRDVPVSEERVQWARQVVTKLWNAARYVQIQQGGEEGVDPLATPPAHVLNRWILDQVRSAEEAVRLSVGRCHVHEAVRHVYALLWDGFCDGYVELGKELLSDPRWRKETLGVMRWALGQVLALAHPVMPFVTRELWERAGFGGELCTGAGASRMPPADEEARAEVAWIQGLVKEIRSVRHQLKVPPALKIDVMFEPADAAQHALWQSHEPVIRRMARVIPVSAFSEEGGVVACHVRGSNLRMHLGGHVDFAQEKARLLRDEATLDKEIAALDARLGNPAFCAKAPESVLEETRVNRQEKDGQRAMVRLWLERIPETARCTPGGGNHP